MFLSFVPRRCRSFVRLSLLLCPCKEIKWSGVEVGVARIPGPPVNAASASPGSFEFLEQINPKKVFPI